MDFLAAHPQMGRSWEGLVIEELIRGLHAIGEGFDCYYYRTGGGAEVDLIIEGAFGRVPFENKCADIAVFLVDIIAIKVYDL